MPTTTVRPTVILAEGNHFLRDALREWLQQSEEIDLIGEVTNGVDAVVQTLKLNPCVLLVDLSFSDIEGLVLVRLLNDLQLGTQVVLLLDEDDREYRSVAHQIGVSACVVKTAPPQDLLATICHLAARGRKVHENTS